MFSVIVCFGYVGKALGEELAVIKACSGALRTRWAGVITMRSRGERWKTKVSVRAAKLHAFKLNMPHGTVRLARCKLSPVVACGSLFALLATPPFPRV